MNYFGVIAWIEEWLPSCEAKETTFVGISSILALFSTPKGAAYCASKAALKSAFDSLRIQYADSNLTFITVMPGPVDTAMLKSDKPVPFKVPPYDAAKLILKKVLAKKAIIIFPLFYRIFFRLLKLLSASSVKKILS